MREWQKKLFFQFPFRYRRCFLLHLKIGSIVRHYIERVFISTATAHSIQNYSLIFEMEARAVKCHRNPFQKLTKHTMKLRIVLYRHRCCRRRENVRIIARESEPTYSGNRFSMTFFLSIPLTAFRSVMMPGLSCVSVFVSNTTRTPDGESWQRLILFSSLSSAYLPAFHLFAIQIASPASVMLLERKKKLPSGDGESYDGGDFGSGLCSTQCDTSFTSP